MTAAAAVCAVPAEAQTYLRYQITGIGQYQPVDGTVVPVGPSSADYFSTSFDVLQSGVVGGSLSLVSDGNVFQALVGGVSSSFVDTANASQSGLLTFNYKSGGETGGVSYQSTVNYADTDTVGGFPTISSIATGNFTATSLNYTQQKYYTFNGVVSGLNVYIDPTFQSGVTFVFGAVPEPAAWIMMILGFGAIGFAMRRRPQQQVAA